jgi:capsular exopolysaccharide synthesis family protein
VDAAARTAGRESGDSLAALEAELLEVDARAAAAGAELDRLRVMDLEAMLRSELGTYESLLGAIGRARSAGPGERLRGPATVAVGDPRVEGLRAGWVAYRSERAGMLSGPSPLASTHPDVQRLSILIASTEATLEAAVRGRIASLSVRIAELGVPEAGGAEGPGSVTDTVRVLESLRELGQRAASLQVGIAGARAAERLRPPPVAIAPGGETERLPSDPWAELLVGLLAGTAIGCAAAIARERLGRREGSGARAARPPAARAASPRAPAGDSEPRPEPVPMLAVIPEVTPTLVEPLENGDFRPGPGQTAGLAAYRELRNRLVESHWGLKTLVVTSAHPGEGKTTTSTNLAATYARQGLKVVLVECDLRRPSLGRYFRITKQVDLMDVLFEGRDWRLALQMTRTPGLYVLLGEKSFPRSGDSLGGPEMKRLLSEITAEYDLVILDSSPLLVAADAILLGPIVEGVLLVVRATRTDPATVEDVIARLRDTGATVVGTVLNDPDGAAEEWLSSASPGPPGARTGSETPVPPSRPS